MKLTATVTKDGVVLSMEDDDGEALEMPPVKRDGYKAFLAAVDALDDAVCDRQIGECVVLVERQ